MLMCLLGSFKCNTMGDGGIRISTDKCCEGPTFLALRGGRCVQFPVLFSSVY